MSVDVPLNPPIWEVNLIVYGSITVNKTIRFSQIKGFRFQDAFYSDIEIRRSRTVSGVEATVTAFAQTKQLAREAAMLFFGQMLDTLAIQINQPLYLNFNDHQDVRATRHSTLRRVQKEEWQEAFKEANILLLGNETTFLRALGWYRKGLHTDDPFDKFLAFWLVIEIVAGKYHPPIPQGRPTGCISQIWESFKALWGECEVWPIISGESTWIDNNYEMRKNIAHGTQPINIDTIKAVTQKNYVIEKVAYKFLVEWREQKLNPQVLPEDRQRWDL